MSGMKFHVPDDIIRKVNERFKKRHGRLPPDEFLSGFIFYDKGKEPSSLGGELSIRRLINLGIPRVTKHPAIISGMIKKGGVLVDAGCGAGDDSRWFQDNGYGNVTGIDMKPNSFNLGYDFYEDRNRKYPRFIEGDVCRMPFENGSVDIVYNASLMHTFKSERTLTDFIAESKRILKPGGIFFGNTLCTKENAEKNETPLRFSHMTIETEISKAFIMKLFETELSDEAKHILRAYFTAVKE